MKTEPFIVKFARKAQRQVWTRGHRVGTQTKSAIAGYRVWQDEGYEEFGDRFVAEHGFGVDDVIQKIDLVDTKERVACELIDIIRRRDASFL